MLFSDLEQKLWKNKLQTRRSAGGERCTLSCNSLSCFCNYFLYQYVINIFLFSPYKTSVDYVNQACRKKSHMNVQNSGQNWKLNATHNFDWAILSQGVWDRTYLSWPVIKSNFCKQTIAEHYVQDKNKTKNH